MNLSRKGLVNTMKRIIALLLVLIMAAMSFAACKGEKEESETREPSFNSDNVVLSTENFSYTRGELSIAFYQYYREFYYNNENIDFYNIDQEASLKDQIYYDDLTWFDYFADMAVEYMSSVLVLCEGAKENGMELNEEDIASIEEAVDSYVRYANDYGYTEEQYFEVMFGPDVDQDCLREYYKKEALAIKYENSVVESYTFTEDELSACVEENKEAFYTIDYISYTFDEDKDANAKASADALLAVGDAESFDAYILDYMVNTLMLKDEEQTTADCYKNNKFYDETSEFSKWAFSDGKAGETYMRTNEVDGEYTVYFLARGAELEDYPTKTVRVLATDITKHETTAKAMEHCENLLSQWKSGEATEESFIELVKAESDDKTASTGGGLIEGLAKSDENLPEGLVEWLFSETTVPGSADIFKSAGIYYIVYLVGDGETKWLMDAEDFLIGEKYSEKKEADIEKYPVEKFDTVIDSLEA